MATKKQAKQAKPTAKSGRDLGSGKPRKDKLGIKAGQRVRLVGRHDDDVKRDVEALGAVVTTSTSDVDWILWALAGPAELAQLNALRAEMRDDAAIWAVWTKGKPELREDDIRN